MNAHQSTADIIRLAPTTDGPAIRAAREEKGWSQAFLAEKAGTSQQTVDRIERGVVRRSGAVLALKAAVGINAPSAILFGSIIRQARESYALSQEELADFVGASQGSVSKWERDIEAPSGQILVRVSRVLGIDLAELGAVQPRERALPGDETREAEVRTAVDASRVSDLRDEIETAYDLLTALDKTGNGIGGDVGHGVSAVALAARAALDNARSMLKTMEASR